MKKALFCIALIVPLFLTAQKDDKTQISEKDQLFVLDKVLMDASTKTVTYTLKMDGKKYTVAYDFSKAKSVRVQISQGSKKSNIPLVINGKSQKLSDQKLGKAERKLMSFRLIEGALGEEPLLAQDNEVTQAFGLGLIPWMFEKLKNAYKTSGGSEEECTAVKSCTCFFSQPGNEGEQNKSDYCDCEDIAICQSIETIMCYTTGSSSTPDCFLVQDCKIACVSPGDFQN